MRLRLVMPALALAVLLSSLDQTIVATALPVIVRELGGVERLPWVVTSYLLTATVSLPIYGKLGDQFGRKQTFLWAIGLFTLGSVISGASQSIVGLVLCRAVQGWGAGGLVVTAMALVGELAPSRERARLQGWLGAVAGVSTVAGPAIGGLIAEHWSWRWIFYVNVPLGALAFVVAILVLPSQARPAHSRIDVAGGALLLTSLTALVLVLSAGGQAIPWVSWQAIGLAAIGVAAAAALLVVERTAPDPIVPLALMTRRTIAAPSLVSFLSGVSLFASTTFAPVFWQMVKGLSPSKAGLMVLPLVGGILVATVVSGELVTRLGRYRIFPIAGASISTLGLAALAWSGPTTPDWWVVTGLATTGVGLGLTLQVLVVMAQGAVDQQALGVATSAITMLRTIGGLIGLAVLGGLFARAVAAGGQAQAIQAVFAVSTAVSVVQFICGWLLKEPDAGPSAEGGHDHGR